MSDKRDLKDIRVPALAFVGDAVYELYIRERVLDGPHQDADRLHAEAVRYVRAESQARALRSLMKGWPGGALSDEETALVKRARNHKAKNRSRSAGVVEYRLATAFEALIGHLYLQGDTERARELMGRAAAVTEAGMSSAADAAVLNGGDEK